MPKKATSYGYAQLESFLNLAIDRKNIAAVLILAMASWKEKKINDCAFSGLLKIASDKVINLK